MTKDISVLVGPAILVAAIAFISTVVRDFMRQGRQLRETKCLCTWDIFPRPDQKNLACCSTATAKSGRSVDLKSSAKDPNTRES